jgi:uncharacterized protein (TIRG00374 family)
MDHKPNEILKIFSAWRILLAVAVGLSASIYLVLRDFSWESYLGIHWSFQVVFFLFLAIILEIIRDLAYMYRIRLLTDKAIGWKHSFQVIMLWEFSSALTPSVIGGSAVALYIVSKEIHNPGKATAIVMITALLDELFYIVMVPLTILLLGSKELFINTEFKFFNFGNFPTQTLFLIGYSFIILLTTTVAMAIFIKPKLFKDFLHKLFSLPLLNRWRTGADHLGEEIMITSKEMKGKSVNFWLKAIGSTFISWTARFLVINAIILMVIGHGDQIMIFARQLIMWVILLISPTPGGSGIAEFILPKFLGEYLGPFGNEIALGWRILSYYSYLIIGSIVLPIWLRRVYRKKKTTE